MTDFSDLPPHLIFGKIFFPTKVAVELSFILSKKYWDQDVVSNSVPVLDFDEDDDFCRHNLKEYDLCQHEKFARFVEGYFEYYREKGHQLLDSLRFNMRLNSSEDATILGRWLELAFERGVKELEIRRPTNPWKAVGLAQHPLSWMTTFANAKSLMSLKLIGVKLTDTWGGTDDFPHLLPSLKSLSLQCLYFEENDDSLYKLLHTCSFIEYLSLTDFHFELEFRLPTRSLKSLEFKECNIPEKVEAYQVQIDILESFTWLSLFPSHLFSWTIVLGMAGKSLTFLRLGRVMIDCFPSANNQGNEHYFPSLKTISFVEVEEVDLLPVLSECPSLENLSLVGCGFKKLRCCVRSSTLKSLEVKHSDGLVLLQVHEAKNLESFTFSSQPMPETEKCYTGTLWRIPVPDSDSDSDFDSDFDSDSDSESKCSEVILDNSFNLKNVDICVTDVVKFSVNGSHPVSGGYLKDFFDGIAPCVRIEIVEP